jgi:hypothetical protein
MDTLEKTLPQIVEELGITSTIKWQDTPATAPDWAQDFNAYRITLNYQGRKMSFNYYQGKAVKHEPTTADAVWTLASDYNSHLSAPTLADFGGEFGWDENTLATYRAVKNLAMRYKKLIGNEETLEMIGQVEY